MFDKDDKLVGSLGKPRCSFQEEVERDSRKLAKRQCCCSSQPNWRRWWRGARGWWNNGSRPRTPIGETSFSLHAGKGIPKIVNREMDSERCTGNGFCDRKGNRHEPSNSFFFTRWVPISIIALLLAESDANLFSFW